MEPLVARAAATGADLVVLPEKWNGLGSHEILLDVAEPLEGGETVEAMSRWARTHGITLVGGSIAERRDGREKLGNTCVVFDPEGEVAAVYRKIHMFDVEVGGVVYRESDSEDPGEVTVSCEVEGWHLGLTVCYDLRFPELYRILAVDGAELVTVPAAFTLYTGKDHWELLLRARAVENQCYVAAANQWGRRRRQGLVRPQLHRRPLGRRPGAGARRGLRDRPPSSTGRTWSGSGGACPRSPTASLPRTRGRRASRPGGRRRRGPLRRRLHAGQARARCSGPRATGRPGSGTGWRSSPTATRPRAPSRSRISSTTRSSTTTRRSGSVHGGHRARHGRSTGPAACARSRRRSPRTGCTRRTSSSTRTCSRCSRAARARATRSVSSPTPAAT